MPLRKRRELLERNRTSPCCYIKPDGTRDLLPAINRAGQELGAPFQLGRHGATLRWHEKPESVFRLIGPAHKVTGLRHTGWYVDHNQDDTCHGLVFRTTRGTFIPGVSDAFNQGPAMLELEEMDAAETCASRADDLARDYAESAREDDAKFKAEQQIEDKQREIAELRDRIRELVAGLRQSTLATSVCDVMRHHIRALRRQGHACHRRIEKLTADHWAAVS